MEHLTLAETNDLILNSRKNNYNVSDANRCAIASLSHWRWEYCSKSNSHLIILITGVITDCKSIDYCICTSNWNSKHSQYIIQSYLSKGKKIQDHFLSISICGTLLFEPTVNCIVRNSNMSKHQVNSCPQTSKICYLYIVQLQLWHACLENTMKNCASYNPSSTNPAKVQYSSEIQ